MIAVQPPPTNSNAHPRCSGSEASRGWLVDERGIEPHVKRIDKAERTDGTFSRSDFAFDPEGNTPHNADEACAIVEI